MDKMEHTHDGDTTVQTPKSLLDKKPQVDNLTEGRIGGGVGGVEGGVEVRGQLFISDGLMWQFNLYLYILLLGAISLFGTVNNAASMVVFHRLSLKDSISVCLFALSFTDFLLSVIVLVGRVCPVWNMFYEEEQGGIDPMAFLYVGPSWMADSLFLCSGWILTFLSLERCVCVVFPFKVKDVFTRNRSVAAVALTYAVTMSTYVPIYVTQRMSWVTEDEAEARGGQANATTSSTSSFSSFAADDDAGSSSRRRHFVIVFAGNRLQAEAITNVFSSTLLPVPPLVITMASVLWMAYGLKTSSKLRVAMTHSSTYAYVSNCTNGEEREERSTREEPLHQKQQQQKQEQQKKEPSPNITNKTRKLVKVVLALAIVFLVCSIPRIVAKGINSILPEVNEGGSGRNLNTFLWQFARFSSCLNASVNIFFYLKINSSYRAKFQELFCRKS